MKENLKIFLIAIICLFSTTGYTQTTGKLPLNKLPVQAKKYLSDNNHIIKCASFIYTSDTVYYVSSRIKTSYYQTSFNQKGQLEYIYEHKAGKGIGIAIIVCIVLLIELQ